jgi:hypothetical protein
MDPRRLFNNQTPAVEEFKHQVCSRLSLVYPLVPILPEWTSMQDEIGIYSPRLDIAVGPFATDRQCGDDYDGLMENNKRFINRLIRCHINNVRKYDDKFYSLSFDRLKTKNYNARCFIAIEIENRVTRKHLIGGAVNASALGRIGIMIPWTPDKMRAAIKLRKYLEFLASVGKNTFDTTNLLILDKNQIMRALSSSNSRNYQG